MYLFDFSVRPAPFERPVYHMLHEDPGDIKYGDIGGLGEQIRELREVIELPLINPQLFLRVGIKPPKGVGVNGLIGGVDGWVGGWMDEGGA